MEENQNSFLENYSNDWLPDASNLTETPHLESSEQWNPSQSIKPSPTTSNPLAITSQATHPISYSPQLQPSFSDQFTYMPPSNMNYRVPYSTLPQSTYPQSVSKLSAQPPGISPGQASSSSQLRPSPSLQATNTPPFFQQSQNISYGSPSSSIQNTLPTQDSPSLNATTSLLSHSPELQPSPNMWAMPYSKYGVPMPYSNVTSISPYQQGLQGFQGQTGGFHTTPSQQGYPMVNRNPMQQNPGFQALRHSHSPTLLPNRNLPVHSVPPSSAPLVSGTIAPATKGENVKLAQNANMRSFAQPRPLNQDDQPQQLSPSKNQHSDIPLGRPQLMQSNRGTHFLPKPQFLQHLLGFLQSRGNPLRKTPYIGGRQVDFYILYRGVCELGGYRKVVEGGLWHHFIPVLGLNGLPPVAVTAALERLYQVFLLSYEHAYFHGIKSYSTQPMTSGQSLETPGNIGGPVMSQASPGKSISLLPELDSSASTMRQLRQLQQQLPPSITGVSNLDPSSAAGKILPTGQPIKTEAADNKLNKESASVGIAGSQHTQKNILSRNPNVDGRDVTSSSKSGELDTQINNVDNGKMTPAQISTVSTFESRAIKHFSTSSCLSLVELSEEKKKEISQSTYFPLIREVETYGGVDCDTLRDFQSLKQGAPISNIMTMRGVTPKFPWLQVFELGSLDIHQVLMSLQSRLPMEVVNALNTLSVYISSITAEGLFGMRYIQRLPMAACEELFDELLNLWDTSLSFLISEKKYLADSMDQTPELSVQCLKVQSNSKEGSCELDDASPVFLSYSFLLSFFTSEVSSFCISPSLQENLCEKKRSGVELYQISLCLSTMIRNWSYGVENQLYLAQHGTLRNNTTNNIMESSVEKGEVEDFPQGDVDLAALRKFKAKEKAGKSVNYFDPILEIYFDDVGESEPNIWSLLMKSLQSGIFLRQSSKDSGKIESYLFYPTSEYQVPHLAEVSLSPREDILQAILEYRKNAITILNNISMYVLLDKIPPPPFYEAPRFHHLLPGEDVDSCGASVKYDLDLDIMDMLVIITCDFLTCWDYQEETIIDTSCLESSFLKVSCLPEEIAKPGVVSVSSDSEHYMLLCLDTLCKLLVKDENRTWMQDDWLEGRILKRKAEPNERVVRVQPSFTPSLDSKRTYTHPRKARREKMFEHLWSIVAQKLLQVLSPISKSSSSSTYTLSISQQSLIEHLLIVLHYFAPFVFSPSWLERCEGKEKDNIPKRKKQRVDVSHAEAEGDSEYKVLKADSSQYEVEIKRWWEMMTLNGSLIRLLLQLSISVITAVLPFTPENCRDTLGLRIPYAQSISPSCSHRSSLILYELSQLENQLWLPYLKNELRASLPMLGNMLGKNTTQGGRVMMGVGVGMLDPLLETLFV